MQALPILSAISTFHRRQAFWWKTLVKRGKMDIMKTADVENTVAVPYLWGIDTLCSIIRKSAWGSLSFELYPYLCGIWTPAVYILHLRFAGCMLREFCQLWGSSVWFLPRFCLSDSVSQLCRNGVGGWRFTSFNSDVQFDWVFRAILNRHSGDTVPQIRLCGYRRSGW